VANNAEYGILKWFAGLESVTGAPGLDLPRLDVAAVAEGYGMRAHRASGPDDLRDALADAIGSSGPALVDAPVAAGMAMG
jgi:benzoylformate decarboxylase